MEINLLGGSTVDFTRSTNPAENEKKIREIGLHDYATLFFSECNQAADTLTTTFTAKVQETSKNSMNAQNLRNILNRSIASTDLSGKVNWGGDDASVNAQKKDLLHIVHDVAPKYNLAVPAHLQDCLKDASETSENFELDLKALKEAKELCQKVMDISSHTEESDRLVFNQKFGHMQNLMKTLMSLTTSIEDVIRKIIQNSQK